MLIRHLRKRPTFMHSVFSPTESQQGCSHPDGEHPTHFSRIKISTAHLTTTLHLHVFLWDDDKWLLRVFSKTKSSVALPFSSPRCNIRPQWTTKSWQPAGAVSVQFMWLFGVTNGKCTEMAFTFARILQFSHNLISCIVVMYGSVTSKWVSVLQREMLKVNMIFPKEAQVSLSFL